MTVLWPLLLRAARLDAGLTQAELARRAGTSRSRLSAYECGRVAPTADTLERILTAADAPLRPEEVRSRELHRRIAQRLVEQPDAVLAKARRNVETMRAADPGGRGTAWLDRWASLLDGPLTTLVSLLVSSSQEARDLRQSTPFAGVLTPAERNAVIRETRRAS